MRSQPLLRLKGSNEPSDLKVCADATDESEAFLLEAPADSATLCDGNKRNKIKNERLNESLRMFLHKRK